MFTGIIEEIGLVKQIANQGSKKYFTITCSKVNSDVKIGDSIACNGICLTLTKFDTNSITIEAMDETIAKTTIKTWSIGSKINLERALKLSGRLDGHIVQGHIDTVLKVISTKQHGETRYLELELLPEFSALVVPQGSIALNGVSLTIARLEAKSFQVALISLTEELTNLSNQKANDSINVEFDIIGKYILRYNSNKPTNNNSKISKEWLSEQGF